MVKVTAYSKTGTKKPAEATLDQTVFGLVPNHDLLSLAYRSYAAGGRRNSAQVMNRGEIRGGGRKPWRQKGTGRARVGSIRVPNWRGGGVVFGPTNQRNYNIELPVKMKRLAIRQALSVQAKDGVLAIMDEFNSTDGKVKNTLELFAKMKLEGFVLLVLPKKTPLVDRATRNIAQLKTISASYLNVYDLLNADHIIMTADALEPISQWLDVTAKKAAPSKAKPKDGSKEAAS